VRKKNTSEEAAAAKARQALLRRERDARKRAEEPPEQTEQRKAKERDRSIRRSAALSPEERKLLNVKQRGYCYKSNHKDVARTRKRRNEYVAATKDRDREKIRANRKNNWKRHGAEYSEKVRRRIAELGLAGQYNEYTREWRKANPDYAKGYHKRPQRNMANRLRCRLRGVLKAIGAERAARTFELLGCTLAEFKVHIETQFYGGMSWDDMNFHLDHIKQVCTFDLTDPEQQKQCFHYTNIRPLTEDDNLRRPKRAA
jgi:hypothetical protein